MILLALNFSFVSCLHHLLAKISVDFVRDPLHEPEIPDAPLGGVEKGDESNMRMFPLCAIIAITSVVGIKV